MNNLKIIPFTSASKRIKYERGRKEVKEREGGRDMNSGINLTKELQDLYIYTENKTLLKKN